MILDMSKGKYVTDVQGNVIGVNKTDNERNTKL